MEDCPTSMHGKVQRIMRAGAQEDDEKTSCEDVSQNDNAKYRFLRVGGLPRTPASIGSSMRFWI